MRGINKELTAVAMSRLPLDQFVDRVSQLMPPFLKWHLIKSATRLSFQLSSCARRIDSFLLRRHLRYAGAGNVESISTSMTKDELSALFNLARRCPQGAAALEIGSYLGASTCYLVAGLTQIKGHLFCVDTWQNETMPEGERDTFAEFQKNTLGLRKWITPVRKRSDEILELDIQPPLALVFIDGDHSYISVKRDFDRVRHWLTQDGVIVFHDFSHHYYEGVNRVVGEALASGKWTIAGLVDTLVWIQPAEWSQPEWLNQSTQANI